MMRSRRRMRRRKRRRGEEFRNSLLILFLHYLQARGPIARLGTGVAPVNQIRRWGGGAK